MLKAKATRNHAGVVIRGTGADLEELYCALNTLMEKRDGLEDGEVPQSGTNLRISGLCHDIRHALPVSSRSASEGNDDRGAMKGPVVDPGRILSFKTGKELPFDLSLEGDGIGDNGLDDGEELEELEELEEFDGVESFDEDYIDAGELDEVYDDAEESAEVEELGDSDGGDADDPAVLPGPGFRYEPGAKTGLPLEALCEFHIMWPELIFICLLLREYLGSRYDLEYSKKRKGLDWTLDWVVVRRFQIVVLDCLCLHVSPGQAKSIRKVFLESFSYMDGYCTQYVDKLTYSFAGKNAEQRLKLLPQLPRKIIARGNDYRLMESEIRSTARDYGCPPWELGLVEEMPQNFEW